MCDVSASHQRTQLTPQFQYPSESNSSVFKRCSQYTRSTKWGIFLYYINITTSVSSLYHLMVYTNQSIPDFDIWRGGGVQSHLSSPLFLSSSVLVATQIRGHIASSSPPSPPRYRYVPCILVARRIQHFLPSSTRVEYLTIIFEKKFDVLWPGIIPGALYNAHVW